MAKDPHWIEHSHMHKGALHTALGVPADHKIPDAKLSAAANSSDPHVRKMANMAKNMQK